jgi:hypothetical protein
MNYHLLDIKNEAAIEDLECDCTLTSKYDDFFVGDLISKTHICRNPFSLVYKRSRNLLPDISLNVIDLNYIYDSLLIYSSSESKDILILEST